MSASQDWDNIPGFDPIKEQYLPLNLGDWLNTHRVAAEGEKLGRNNKPSAEEHGLDAMEMKIADWINQRGRICRQNVGTHLSDLERELVDLESEEQIAIREQRIEQRIREAELALGGKVRAIRNALADKENDVRIGAEEFERFRHESRLTRLPDYSHRRSAGWIIAICALVEIVLNASLLMEVNAFGLLGSTMQMGLISAVNVLFAGLAMGALLRQRHHVSNARKSVAWAGMAVLLAAVAVFNLAVGHFRDSMQAIVDNPSADVFAVGGDALQRLAAGPFDLGSFQTALLILLGILCFAIGAWKWFQRDDAYPDYGRQDRLLDDKKAAYAAAYQSADRELRETYQEHQDQLADMLHQLETKQSKWQDICMRGNRLAAEYSRYLSQYQTDLDYLLAEYRSANRNARSEPAPPHFDDPVPVNDAILQAPTFNPPEAASMKGVGDSVHEAITKLQNAYDAATANIPTLEALAREGAEAFRARSITTSSA